MEPFKGSIIKHNLRILRWFGFRRSSAIFRQIFALVAISAFFTSSFLYILSPKYNIVDKTQPALSVTFIISFVSKYVYMLYYKQKIFSLLDVIDLEWAKSKKNEFGSIRKRAEKYGTVVFIVNASMMISIALLGGLLPVLITFYRTVLVGEENLNATPAFKLEFRVTNGIINDVLNQIYTAVFVIPNSIQAAAVESFFIAITLHVTAMFQLLQSRIVEINLMRNHLENVNNKRTKDAGITENTAILSDLTDCVLLHEVALRGRNALEEVFNMPLLIKFSMNSAKICIELWAISNEMRRNLQSDTPSNLSLYIGFLISDFAGILSDCICGQFLINQSSLVADTLYEKNWYNVINDKKFEKIFLMLLRKSQEPVVLTAGKFYDISLDTFAAVVKGTCSYFAFLQNI